MAIPETTLELIERFERNRDAYQSSAYNEFQLRKEFLDPLFESLGWICRTSSAMLRPTKMLYTLILRVLPVRATMQGKARIGKARQRTA